MAMSAEAFKGLNTGMAWGGIIGGVATGVIGGIMARNEARFAAKMAERQGQIARRSAEWQAYAMEQEALDFLTLADWTAANSILDAQDVERIGRYRSNVIRAAGEQRRGDIRARAGAQGTTADDPGSILALAADVEQTELAALAERYQGDMAGYQLRTEGEQLRYKARLGLTSARRGQRLIMAGADAQMRAAQMQAGQIRTQGDTSFYTSLMQSFLGPQTLSSIVALIGKKEPEPEPVGFNFDPFNFGRQTARSPFEAFGIQDMDT